MQSEMARGARIWTVGHGTATAEGFAELVCGAGVESIVDVRRFPGSRRNPHFARDEMAVWLADHDVSYQWLPALGGRRRSHGVSPNIALRNPQFRAYADHMATGEFAAGVRTLLAEAAQADVAVMCSESLWWRCHRRLLADHLVLVETVQVEHLLHDARLTEHPVTPGARRAAGHVVYDVPV
jgi:uncharacterized protein (DUF488 family)